MNSIFIFGAKYLFILSFIVAGIYFLKQSRTIQKKIFMLAVISFPILYIVALLVGHIYFDPRPFEVGHFTPLIPHSSDNGFPSDHALITSALASLFYFFNRRISLVLWIVTIFVSISRIYVGVHHPIDIIGSMIISFVVVSIVWFIVKKYQKTSINSDIHN